MKIKKSVRIVLGLLVSLASLVFLAVFIDWREVGHSFARVNYWYILPAVGVVIAANFFRALQWRAVLGNIRRIPVGKLFRITMIGLLATDVLPARLGEVARAYFLGRKEKLSHGTAFGSVIVTRLLDGAVLFLFLGGLAILIPTKIAGVKAGATTGIMVYLAVLGFFVLFYFKRKTTAGIIRFVVAPFSKRAAVKAVNFMEKFIHGFSCFRRPGDLLKAVGYTFAIWLLIAASYYFLDLGFSFSTELPVYAPFLLVAIVSLAVAVPSSPGFIGTMELGVMAGLQIIRPALTRNEMLTYGVLVHAVQIVPTIFIGLVFLWTEQLTFVDLTKVEEMESGG